MRRAGDRDGEANLIVETIRSTIMLISSREPGSHVAMIVEQATPTVYACSSQKTIPIRMFIKIPAPPHSHVAVQGKLRASE